MMELYYSQHTVGNNSRDNPSQQSEDNPCCAWIGWNDITTDTKGLGVSHEVREYREDDCAHATGC